MEDSKVQDPYYWGNYDLDYEMGKYPMLTAIGNAIAGTIKYFGNLISRNTRRREGAESKLKNMAE